MKHSIHITPILYKGEIHKISTLQQKEVSTLRITNALISRIPPPISVILKDLSYLHNVKNYKLYDTQFSPW
jgi:hypothetical protein